SRDFRPAWPAARNSSRHRESVAAVTPSSRESSSRASPRRRRRTASALRLEEHRPRSFPDFCFPIGPPFRGHHAAVGCPRKSWCGGEFHRFLPPRFVPVRRPTEAEHSAGAPLGNSECSEKIAHSLAPSGGLYHFFWTTALSIWM